MFSKSQDKNCLLILHLDKKGPPPQRETKVLFPQEKNSLL